MKKALSAALVCFFVLVLSSFVFAQDNPQGDKAEAPGMKHERMMMEPGAKGPGDMMEHGKKMMGIAGGRSMVATSDGGVVVLFGSKLQKYDKNLVLQKEVEIKMDKEMMLGKMKCPKMAEKEGASDKKEGANAQTPESMGMSAPDNQQAL